MSIEGLVMGTSCGCILYVCTVGAPPKVAFPLLIGAPRPWWVFVVPERLRWEGRRGEGGCGCLQLGISHGTGHWYSRQPGSGACVLLSWLP